MHDKPEQQVHATQQTSSLAQVSLILGIASYFTVPLLGAIVAVITGRMAKREIQAHSDTLSGDNFARWGLILGWVNIGLSIFGMICLGLMFAFGILSFSVWFVPALTMLNLLLDLLGFF